MSRLFLLLYCCNFLCPSSADAQSASWNYDSSQVRKCIRKIAARIEKDGEIDDWAIGYELVRTPQFDRFVKLTKKARNRELVTLTGHRNPAVRCYAFHALVERRYEGVQDIYSTHADDTESVVFNQGCMGGKVPVVIFMCWLIYEQDWDSECNKIISDAFEKMKSKKTPGN